MRGECVVYWLHDITCFDMQTDGYVGISSQLTTRISRQRAPYSPEVLLKMSNAAKRRWAQSQLT